MKALDLTLVLAIGFGTVQLGLAGTLRPYSSLSTAFALIDQEGTTQGDFRVRLLSSISTDSNKTGDLVRARVLAPEALRGDILEGKIHFCKKGGKVKGDAVLAFSFDKLHHQGRIIPIKSWIRSVSGTPDVDLNNEGILRQRNENLENSGISAMNGAYYGALDGDLKVAGIGAGVGAGMYLSWAWLTGSKARISLTEGTELSIDMEDLEQAKGTEL